MLTIKKLQWQKLLRGAGLTPVEYMVLVTISTYGDEYGRQCRPGWKRLIADTGLNVKTVKKAVASVVAQGWLVQVEEGGNQHGWRKANVYDLAIPEGGYPVDPFDSEGAQTTTGRGPNDDHEGGYPVDPHQVITSSQSSSPKLHEQSSIARSSFTSDPQAASPATDGFADQRRNPGPFTISQRMQLIDDIVAIAHESVELAKYPKNPETREDTESLGRQIDRLDDAMDTLTTRFEEYFHNSIGDEYLLVDLLANGKWTIPHKCVDRYEAGIELNKMINTAGLGHLTPADHLEVPA